MNCILHGLPELPQRSLRTLCHQVDTHASPSRFLFPEELGLCNKPMSSSFRWLDSDTKLSGLFLSTSSNQLASLYLFWTHSDTSGPEVQKSTTPDPYLVEMISLQTTKKNLTKHIVHNVINILKIFSCHWNPSKRK